MKIATVRAVELAFFSRTQNRRPVTFRLSNPVKLNFSFYILANVLVKKIEQNCDFL